MKKLILVLMFVLMFSSVMALDKESLCDKLGFNLSMTEDFNDCGELWDLLNNDTNIYNTFTNVSYYTNNETTVNNNYIQETNNETYSKEEIEELIASAFEKKEIDSLKEELAELKAEKEEPVKEESNEKDLTLEEVQEAIKLQMLANEDSIDNGKVKEARIVEQKNYNTIFGIDYKIIIILGIILILYLWKSGKLKQFWKKPQPDENIFEKFGKIQEEKLTKKNPKKKK